MMNYLVLMKTISGKGGEFWEAFRKIPTEPMKGVMIESSWSLWILGLRSFIQSRQQRK
jgi:hypothetical protein